jgi:hypothetical protein
MRKGSSLLAVAIVLAAALAMLTPAHAMTPSSAFGMQTAFASIMRVDEAVYVCRHRVHTSRRVCWWQPGPYRGWYLRPWRRSQKASK